MAIELRVPPVGESVKEAIITTWFKKVGDRVKRDEKLVELETDKVNVEVNAKEDGVLTAILKQAGDQVVVDELIGHMEQGGLAETPAPAPAIAAVVPSPTPLSHKAADVVSPAARKVAEEKGIDPSTVHGTGRDGRVMKDDVLAAAEKKVPVIIPEVSHPAPTSVGREERVKMSPLRRKLAERLVHVQQTAAILTTFNEVDMSAIQALRARYQDRFVKRYNTKIGFMSFFTKACIEGLKAWPGINAEITGDEIIYKYHYDIGVAVGGGKGLVVPVIKGADQLSFAELELKIAEFGKRAKENKLTLDELTGGTFTISNGGIYGSMMSTPILNPPQTAILGMHNIIERPVAVEGKVEIRPMMYLALSYDHRVVDGREAVSFLVRVKECLESPERMLLEV